MSQVEERPRMFWPKSKPSKTKLFGRLANPFRRYGKVYIVPTAFGFYFLGGSVLMILIGSAYSNNLVNLLGFFMLALCFTAMSATARNVSGIVIARIEKVRGFAGEELPISMVVKNQTANEKSNCDFSIKGLVKINQYDARGVVRGHGELRLVASFKSPLRGFHHFDLVSLATTAPFGLFKAWQYQPVDIDAVIYPERSGIERLPQNAESTSSLGGSLSQSGTEDFLELRGYRAGDNLRRVAWKAFARSGVMLTQEFIDTAPAGLLLDLNSPALQHLPLEGRLKQLSKWIDLAQNQRRPFVLKTDHAIGPDSGLHFAHRAWTLLAEYPQARETQ